MKREIKALVVETKEDDTLAVGHVDWAEPHQLSEVNRFKVHTLLVAFIMKYILPAPREGKKMEENNKKKCCPSNPIRRPRGPTALLH